LPCCWAGFGSLPLCLRSAKGPFFVPFALSLAR